jgi:hypothetical protein
MKKGAGLTELTVVQSAHGYLITMVTKPNREGQNYSFTVQ